MYASARLVLCGRSLAAASIFLCTDSFELCYGLNKLYTASTGYTGNYKPSGHSSALAALGSLQPGPRVYDFSYIPDRTLCITVIYVYYIYPWSVYQILLISKCLYVNLF